MKKLLNNTPGDLKSSHTEEPYHLFLRPMASVIVRILKNTSVSPNHLTLLSAATGIAAGILTGWASPAAGGILLLISMILDCADGQLARIRGGGSRIGRILDGMSDYITALSIHIGLGLYLAPHISAAWIWVAAAALSMAVHCIYFDQKKQWFLSRTIRHPATAQEIYNSPEKFDSFPVKIFLSIYKFYLLLQSKIPYDSNQSHYIEEKEKRREFIKKNGPSMHLARLLGPAGHNFLIAVSLIMTVAAKKAPFFYVLLVITAFNLLYLTLRLGERTLDLIMKKQLPGD